LLVRAANALVYYGLSVNSTAISGNKYLNFSLVALVEIPGYTLAWVAMDRWGRRRPLAGSLLLCTATCLTAAFVPQGTSGAGLSPSTRIANKTHS
jgi:OCT family organic cation transporter-like MFS transporter 4/5